MTTPQSLFADDPKPSVPVECLGQTFPSDAARREHYLAILREKLKDPSFRKIEGFPIGTDEDILALSDPPYYTACPNPFVEDFIKHFGKPYDKQDQYNKEPFAADVSEGRSGLFYDAHTYHTKVPHKAIMRFILHYTQPGDIVFDGFCGTGMTGVAAQLCGDRETIQSLGYKVDSNGSIYTKNDVYGAGDWRLFSKIGDRRALLSDLSPAAAFIAHCYNTPVSPIALEAEAKRVMKEAEKELGWMYETIHPGDFTKGKIKYTIWSDVFSCTNCAGEVVFWDAAVDSKNGVVREEFICPHCSAKLTKRGVENVFESHLDKSLNTTIRKSKQVPVLINYSIGKKRYEKKPDQSDFDLIKKVEYLGSKYSYPTERLMEGGETRRNDPIGITHTHHFYTKRNLLAVASLNTLIEFSPLKNQLKFWISSYNLAHSTRMTRIIFKSGGVKPVLTGYQSGTLYVGSMPVEKNVFDGLLKQKLGIIVDSLGAIRSHQIVSTTSATSTRFPSECVDYIFLDPPFGANLNYSELNFLWEAWLKILTNIKQEAIENKKQGKSIDDYRFLMAACFKEAFRVLKPGRWMTVEFSNTQASVWNTIQTALQEAGFVVANVSALDKKQGSFKAVTTTTAVKQDLVISAYKPNGGLEERFTKSGGSEDSAWDFVRTHLKYLPTIKIKDGQIEFVAERDPRIIFDRLVAWFVRHSFPVPLSSQEFQAGLSQRFAERDGMVFLPEQVSEYDKKRMQTAKAPQMEMFIADERSAIDWLSDFLKKKPSTYQEIHPEFIKQLGAGWKKHEAKPELSYLLESNFLCYDSKDKDGIEVPSQIHSYLSTNWQELRNLEKSDPRLKAKATERWYVPDPNKGRDLEMIREKALLKEFETYRSFTGRRLKTFRLEAMRTGFKTAWANRDYATIIAVAQKVPEEALQEDEKLLLWYDQALTRSEAGA